MLTTDMPDFAGMVKTELNLTEDEASAFLRLEVAYLAQELDDLLANDPDNSEVENWELQQSHIQNEEQYEILLSSSSHRVAQAMARYLQLKIDWLKSQSKNSHS